MKINDMLVKLVEYGPIIIVIIMYLEGLNMSGIPSVVIMPAIGVYISITGRSFLYIFAIALIASILGNLTYYLIASKLGDVIYRKIAEKMPSMKKTIDKAMRMIEKYGNKACFIGRILPGARTFVSLVSGIFKISLKDFLIYSSLGIAVWNFNLTILGYLVANFSLN